MWVRPDELVPLEIFLHGDRTGAEMFDGIISIVAFASEDTSDGVEGFLDLADNYGLKLAS